VGTFSRSLTAEAAGPWVQTRDRSLISARTGVAALVDLTMPGGFDTPVPEPAPGTVSRLAAYTRDRADEHETWTPVTWRLAGRPMPARVWHFAGAWTGFTSALSEECLVVVGFAIDPADVDLVDVGIGDDYGLDLRAPLDRRHAAGQQREWPESILPKPNRHGWHADQRRLLGLA
jgi:hypothetical protein